jgi:CubicO group peptidase (beta-lactamase class C family)
MLMTMVVGARQEPAPSVAIGAPAFESYIELLRQQAGIPAISGVLRQDGKTVWEGGLGYANQEERIGATPSTPYLVADLTQMLSAVLLLQCVEQRHLNLNTPVRAYGLSLDDENTTLRDVLSHTSPASSGGSFSYDAARYARLAGVMERCAPQPFRKSIAHRLLERAGMSDSVPGTDLADPGAVPDDMFTDAALARYRRVLDDLAVPYRVDKRGKATPNDVPVDGLNAASGLVTTARDLARFDDWLDDGDLLRDETMDAAWSQTELPNGSKSPTGIGWFVQNYRGTRVVWHYGFVPNGYSALIVKVPSRRTTMILLANSDGLGVASQLESGDVTRSLFATVFLRMLL